MNGTSAHLVAPNRYWLNEKKNLYKMQIKSEGINVYVQRLALKIHQKSNDYSKRGWEKARWKFLALKSESSAKRMSWRFCCTFSALFVNIQGLALKFRGGSIFLFDLSSESFSWFHAESSFCWNRGKWNNFGEMKWCFSASNILRSLCSDENLPNFQMFQFPNHILKLIHFHFFSKTFKLSPEKF